MDHCLLAFFFSLFFQTLCICDYIPVGTRISISIPSSYNPGFQAKAYILRTGVIEPTFKAALSIQAFDGKYLCSLVVLFGEMEVWNSRSLSQFFALEHCALELMKNGVLQITDATRKIGWRTGTSGQGVERLQLLRTGNLVLTDARNNTMWQTFDLPSHIILWGQRLYTPAQLTSPAADSTSSYSMEIQRDKIALYLYSGALNYSYWEFKPSKNREVEFIELGSTGLKLFSKTHRKVAQISSYSPEPIRFLALGKNGDLVFYHYSRYKGKFEVSFHVLNNSCDLPLTCGPYGICTSSNSCSCMQFSRKLRHIQSKCDEGFSESFCERNDTVKMVELQDVTSVLRTADPILSISKQECVSLCTKNCSCASVLFSYGEVARDLGECFHYQLVGGVKQVEREVGESFLIKVPEETVDRSRNTSGIKDWLLIFGGVINVLAILLIFGGVIWFVLAWKRKQDTVSENS